MEIVQRSSFISSNEIVDDMVSLEFQNSAIDPDIYVFTNK